MSQSEVSYIHKSLLTRRLSHWNVLGYIQLSHNSVHYNHSVTETLHDIQSYILLTSKNVVLNLTEILWKTHHY